VSAASTLVSRRFSNGRRVRWRPRKMLGTFHNPAFTGLFSI
jgi:hypothetical protein